jgi:hypothetical protein
MFDNTSRGDRASTFLSFLFGWKVRSPGDALRLCDRACVVVGTGRFADRFAKLLGFVCRYRLLKEVPVVEVAGTRLHRKRWCGVDCSSHAFVAIGVDHQSKHPCGILDLAAFSRWQVSTYRATLDVDVVTAVGAADCCRRDVLVIIDGEP